MGDDWRPVKGHASHYEVDRAGNIRRLDGRLIGQWANSFGYMRVRLSNPRALRLVHRVVAEAWIENPFDLPLVNHIDNDRANNAASNLEWCTQAHNLAHARRQGRMQNDYWKGKRSPGALLSDEDVAELRSVHGKGGCSHSDLASMFGICKRSVGRILSGRTYANVC